MKAGAFHGDGANIRAYFKGSADLPLEKDTPIKGDILTLGAGFGFTSKDGSVSYLVEEDIKYVYTGAFWYAGTTLPRERKYRRWKISRRNIPTIIK